MRETYTSDKDKREMVQRKKTDFKLTILLH